MKSWAIAAAVLLASCAAEDGPLRDQVGNLYPKECHGDLSWVDAPFQSVSREWLALRSTRFGAAPGERILGVTFARHSFVIDETLSGWQRDDAIRHERCHILRGDWHDEPTTAPQQATLSRRE
jgi:hypothetical protein